METPLLPGKATDSGRDISLRTSKPESWNVTVLSSESNSKKENQHNPCSNCLEFAVSVIGSDSCNNKWFLPIIAKSTRTKKVGCMEEV